MHNVHDITTDAQIALNGVTHDTTVSGGLPGYPLGDAQDAQHDNTLQECV